MLNSSLLKFLLGLSSAYLFGILPLTQVAVAQEKPKIGLLFAGPKGSAAITAFVKGMEDLGYEMGGKIHYKRHQQNNHQQCQQGSVDAYPDLSPHDFLEEPRARPDNAYQERGANHYVLAVIHDSKSGSWRLECAV